MKTRKLSALLLAAVLLLGGCRGEGGGAETDEEIVEKTDTLTNVYRRTAFSVPEDYSLTSGPLRLDSETGALVCLMLDGANTLRLVTTDVEKGVLGDPPFDIGDGMLLKTAVTERYAYAVTAVNDGENPIRYYLNRRDPETGKLEVSDDLCVTFGERIEGILSMAATADGTVWLSTSDKLFALNESFGLAKKLPIERPGALFADPDGGIWMTLNAKVRRIDPDAPKGGEDFECGEAVKEIAFDGDHTFLYSTAKGIFGVRVTDEGNETELLMSYENSNVTPDSVELSLAADAENFIFREERTRSYVPVLYHRGEDVDLSAITVLEVADILGIDVYPEPRIIKTKLVEYNRDHPEIRLSVRDYTQYNTKENPDGGSKKLMIDMLTGVYKPDFVFSGTDDKNLPELYENGLCADLDPYLEADPEVNRDTVPGAMQRFFATQDGGMWAIAPSFYCFTLAARADVLGPYAGREKTGWTIGEMLDFLESLPADAIPIYRCSRENAFSLLFGENVLSAFYDRESASCDFTGETFLRLLRYYVSLPADYNELVRVSPLDGVRDGSRFQNQYDGKVAFYNINVASPDNLAKIEAELGTKDYVLIGYPSENGNGSRVYTRCCLVMTSFCTDPDAGWDWIKTIMKEPYEMGLEGGSSSSSCENYRKAFEKRAEGVTVLSFSTGSTSYYGMSEEVNFGGPGYVVRLSDEDCERGLSFLCETAGQPLIFTVPEQIRQIVNEEISALVGGVGSAEDCAKKIQSRVSIWLAEHQ